MREVGLVFKNSCCGLPLLLAHADHLMLARYQINIVVLWWIHRVHKILHGNLQPARQSGLC